MSNLHEVKYFLIVNNSMVSTLDEESETKTALFEKRTINFFIKKILQKIENIYIYIMTFRLTISEENFADQNDFFRGNLISRINDFQKFGGI